MIDKKDLEKLIERYDKKAETAFRNYQETGMGRYDTECRNAEDMAEALRAAYNAAAEHETLISLRAQIILWASQADDLVRQLFPPAVESMLLDIVAYAEVMCHYKKRETVKED